MTKEEKYNKWLNELKQLIVIPRWNYTIKIDSWWFPSDVSPHNPQLKYRCKKLYEAGLLERLDGSRWGYSYRFRKIGKVNDG